MPRHYEESPARTTRPRQNSAPRQYSGMRPDPVNVTSLFFVGPLVDRVRAACARAAANAVHPCSGTRLEHEDCDRGAKFDKARNLVGFCVPLWQVRGVSNRDRSRSRVQTPLTWFGLTCQSRAA